MKIAILMGGTSTERDVSISTGKAVSKACKQLGYTVEEVVLDDSIETLQSRFETIDVVFNAMHGGEGENGEIQRWFDEENILYTGTGAEASSLCMDKHLSKKIVNKNGWDTPSWHLIHPGQEIPNEIIFPLVVKPNDQGSTVGLSIVHKKDEIKSAIDHACVFSHNILLETFIPGREITVAVVGENVYPIVEIIPSHDLYDYECKYTSGMSRYECPAKLPKELTKQIQQEAMDIYKTLGCTDYGRVDFRLDPDNRYWFLELNTLPGMTDTSLVPKAFNAVGGTFPELIKIIIQEALNR